MRLKNTALSRRAMFFSPIHYCDELLSPDCNYLKSEAARLHFHSLQTIKKMRQAALKKISSDLSKKPFLPNQVVKLIVGDDKAPTLDGSKALQNTTEDIFKVLDVQSGGIACRIKSLTNANEKTVGIDRLKHLDLGNCTTRHQ